MRATWIVGGVIAAIVAPAWAGTTGGIRGIVGDTHSGEAMPGVTVVAMGPALAQEQYAITDENGQYEIELPPGTYTLTFYYLDEAVEKTGIVVYAGRITTAGVFLDESQQRGETIEITASAPTSTMAPPPSESYTHHDDNPFTRTAGDPTSTFSIDVDTASYANVRRFLVEEKALPPPDAVRVEELLNYFPYDYKRPSGHIPFTINTEVGPAPWAPTHQLVRIGLQSQAMTTDTMPPRNLVFLLDVSGSMSDWNKLPLLAESMNLLVDTLRTQDRISIVLYAGAEGLALPPTGGNHKPEIKAVLGNLDAGGSTNGGAGIRLAYETAQKSFISGGINRVILCTDGDWNVGVTDEGDLTKLVEKKRESGIALTVLGFGMGNLKDSMMEKLADHGDGNYAYIDSLAEARKVLVKEAGATLATVAKDVKLQVEMNPKAVASYRLIGYEDRLLADQDFADDTKDAGELGAGHAVTALYEIVPTGDATAELMTVKARFKPLHGKTSKLVSVSIPAAHPALEKTTTDFRWAAAVAGYGMMLRGSKERGALSWPMVHDLAAGALGADPEGYRADLLTLVDTAAKL